jgi:hypothetical protein
MAAPIRLIARLALGIMLAVAVAACGDSEATQRAAFIEYLKTRIVDKPGVHVPKPTAEEDASFGEYAKHYAVIVNFNAAMDKTVSQPLRDAMAAGSPHSLEEAVARRKDIATMRNGLGTIRGALDAELAKADMAHVALKQPTDLKPVFDAAYDRDVTKPANAMSTIFPDADLAMQALVELADFIDKNKSAVKINGSLVQVSDPALQGKLQTLLNAVRAKQDAIQKAQQRLHEVAYGS